MTVMTLARGPLGRFTVPLTLATLLGSALVASGQDIRPTFSSSVAVVPISAVVRDARRRIVRSLGQDDFQVLENGSPRRIIDFRSTDQASVSLGLLVDTSGSMHGPNLARGIEIVDRLLDSMNASADEAALFTFDRAIRQETPFTNDPDHIRDAFGEVNAWGLTSLYDAIADTAKALEHRPALRRAVVVITDGLDTSSALTSEEVSALASAIDVPVYVVAVVPPRNPDSRGDAAGTRDSLSDLASWTGGDVRHIAALEGADLATAALMAELHQQYFIAIESASTSGWHRLDVKTLRRGLTVRARGGYFAAPSRAQSGR